MSDDEDDYLSDKFLVDTAPPKSAAPKTYADRRREAQRASELKNAQGRTLSRAERERAAREEGLARSLFERAREEEELAAAASGSGNPGGGGGKNKALAMMMKMGFKPGQALGRDEGQAASGMGDLKRELEAEPSVAPPEEEVEAEPVRAGIGARPPARGAAEGQIAAKAGPSHRTVPLALNEWQGKKGIGLGKRAASPGVPERLAKMAKMAEDRTHASFRDRARQEYEERRAAGRLRPAQRTCATLDEKAGVQFNVLWLNPEDPDTFPEGLLDALDDPALVAAVQRQRADHSLEGRLRAKMQADSLRPLKALLDDVDADEDGAADKAELRSSPYSEEELQEAVQFLRLGASDRLTLVLDYLRRKYAYCFWCGTQYGDDEDMDANCPGPDEDAHD